MTPIVVCNSVMAHTDRRTHVDPIVARILDALAEDPPAQAICLLPGLRRAEAQRAQDARWLARLLKGGP